MILDLIPATKYKSHILRDDDLMRTLCGKSLLASGGWEIKASDDTCQTCDHIVKSRTEE